MRRAMAGPRAAAAAAAVASLQRLRAPLPFCAAPPPTAAARVFGGGRRRASSSSSSVSAGTAATGAAAEQASLTLEHAQTSTSTIYDSPALYDDAFGYRSFRSEAAFLLDAYRAYSLSASSSSASSSSGGGGGNGGGNSAKSSGSSGALPSSVLDIGCGPGSHAIEMALVLPALASVAALDASAPMLRYARKKAAAAGAARSAGAAPGPSARGAALEFVEGDMTSFSLQAAGSNAPEQQQPLRRFDLATCLLGTLSHALTNAAAAAVLRRAAAHLRPGGLLVLELAHPGDLFDGTLLLGEGQPEMWEVPRKHSAPAAAAGAGAGGGKGSPASAADKGGFGAAAASKAKPAPAAAAKRAATSSSAPPENLLVEWGAAGDDFDPLTQVLQRTVTITALLPEPKDGGKAGAAARAAAARARADALARAAAAAVSGEVDDDGAPVPPLPGQAEGEDDPFAGRRGAVVARQVVACRQFTAQEVELLASAAGLDLAAVHGEMRMDVPSLSHEDAYRMVAVMRKPLAAAAAAAVAAAEA